MAEEPTVRHVETLALEDLSREQFIALASEATQKLGWRATPLTDTGFTAYTDNGPHTWNIRIQITVDSTTATLASTSVGHTIANRDSKALDKFISALTELERRFTDEQLTARYAYLKAESARLEREHQAMLESMPEQEPETKAGFLSFFKPVEGYFVTPLLIILNIVVFIAMVATGAHIINPNSATLLAWGANSHPYTLDGEWWRLITSCFVHIGIHHILMNMYALVFIGLFLEPILGRTRFIAAYLLTGITGSIASLWWHDLVVGAGASGAIFGMFGLFLALLTTKLVDEHIRKDLLKHISIVIGLNLLLGIQGHIDNAAHIGGLLGGMLIGYAYVPALKNPEDSSKRTWTLALPAVLICLVSFVVYSVLPYDPADKAALQASAQVEEIGVEEIQKKFEAGMKEFHATEEKAVRVFPFPDNASREEVLSKIRDSGIYNWQKNIALLDSLQQLDLPDVLRARLTAMKKYCELRVQTYELIYKSVEENTEKYDAQISEHSRRVEAIIKELNGQQSE